MSEQTANGRRARITLAATVVVLGLAQPALIALALARVVDPGATTFEIVGVLVGLGMAAGALACALYVPSRRRAFTTIGAVGVVAGLATAGVWLSWFGSDINTGDLTRVGILLGADVLFTVWLVAAALLMDRDWALAGFYELAFVMSVRAVAEIWLLALLFTASGGPGNQNAPMLFVAVAVLIGWLVLAVWEIAFGTRILRGVPHLEQPQHSAA